MKKLFSNATLKQKLTTIILVVCGIVLLLSSLAYFSLEIISFRRLLVAHKTSLAEVVAANAAVALPFNDRELARNTLSALASEPNIKLAYIFDKQNEPLAQYLRRGDTAQLTAGGFPRITEAEYRQLAEGLQAGEKNHFLSSRHLAVFRPVISQGQHLGMVYINSDLGAFSQWKRLFAGSVLAVLGLSFLLAYLLSRQLQSIVSRPIHYLLGKMNRVTREGDFSVRAEKDADDEVGALIDGFNAMLTHLQDRDRQLADYQHHLEELVGKRTEELRSANEELRGSVAELEKTRDAAQAANQTKSRFLANISHELRTPMVGVLSSTELLLNSGLDSEQLSLVETLNRSGESLLEILNDLLDLAKIEAGKLSLEHVKFDLLEVIACPVDLLGKIAFGKGLELVCDVAPEVPAWLWGDPGRLRQVLFNLLSNAVKFTHEGEVVLRIRPEQERADSVVLRFEVADTGIGIDPSLQQSIFDSFSQADDSTTRLHGGTGLGLSIVKQLVGMMGGQIAVSSEPGLGSVFSFGLSLNRGPDTLTDRVWGDGRSILVLEKNFTAGRVLEEQLRHAGWSVQLCHSDTMAARKMEEARALAQVWDVVLVNDIFLAGGPSLFLEGLERALADGQTRLVAMGSKNSRAIQDQQLRDQVASYLCKPLLPQRLLSGLKDLVPLDASLAKPFNRLPEQGEGGSADSVSREVFATVLVAEDNPTTGKLIDISLSSLGYRVTIAMDGQSAVKLMAGQAFDLVLMDCQMPVMDGYSAARAMRAAGCRVPIIALTASSRQEEETRCREAGMDDFLCKPFRHTVLHEVIRQWLERSRNLFKETE